MSSTVRDDDVVLVHDYLLVLRGAERTFHAMAECWPTAPVRTLLYDDEGTRGRFAGRSVQPSGLQRLGVGQDGFRRLLPLFPATAARLDVGDARVVVSSSSAFAHGVTPAPGATHVCYCHSPFRYVWHERERALDEVPRRLRGATARLLDRIREWDLAASARVDHYIANSRITQERIADFYGRESTVIHPPVEIDRFDRAEAEDFFLVVCELVAHKNVDVALQAARRANVPIKVVGDGPERERLERAYSDRAEFLGRVGDRELEALYARCRAFVMPAAEEFGIVAVEALASGRPVVAAAVGGALEIVTPATGVLVGLRDVDALAHALRTTDFDAFDPVQLQRRARTFSRDMFRLRLTDEVDRRTAERDEPAGPLSVPAGRFRRRRAARPATAA